MGRHFKKYNMVRSLTSGISGLQQSQVRMDVISNNIANVNTTAFKYGRVEFADSFSQTLQGSSASTGTTSGTDAMQIGSGVATSAIQNVYTQGSISRTGFETDLAISGEGYFVVKNPQTGTEYATRAGDFRLDSNGYLVTSTGLRVQGYSDGGTTMGDIKIDCTGATDPTAKMESFTIDKSGVVTVKPEGEDSFTRGQVLLQRFSDEQALMKEGDNLYSGLSLAGPLSQSSAPNTSGLGYLQSGALELSNVDLATEFTSMITTQRGFQASSRVITTTDEMLQELVNLKR
jgi:flagellar hook protein FlgE